MSDPNFPVIEGVRLLNTITNQLPDWASAIAIILIIIGIVCLVTVIGLWEDMSIRKRISMCAISAITISGAMLFGVLVYKPPIYQCLVDSSVSYQKLTETFNVVEQHGEIIDLMLK